MELSLTWTPESDPAYGAETRKYDKPIPSRAYLLTWLSELGRPATLDEILADLGLAEPDQAEGVARRLQAMERAGQLVCNRRGAWGLPERMDLIAGRVSAHRDGFGFLVPDDASGDLFLAARQMRTLIDGDRVLVRVIGLDGRGRREAEVVSVTDRAVKTLVGRLVTEGGTEFLVPDNKKVVHEFVAEPHPGMNPGPNDFVFAEIVAWPQARLHGRVRILEVIGDVRQGGMETDVAIRSYGIPHRFPEDVEREAASFRPEPDPAHYHYRLDLRGVPLVTIDGEDARDFDDAVYAEARKGGGWHLVVAIADVSHYVLPGSALEREARERGNSVYFPDKVVPMLPEALSNGLCSLNPQVDRFCLACEMTISAEGKITHYRFHEAVMRSHARLTYNKVAAILEQPESAEAAKVRREIGALEGSLHELYALYQALKAAREVRGAIDFDTVETKIQFTAQRKIERIVPVQRNDAHKLIEECMLAANTCAAKLLIRTKTPVLYRNHEGPTPERLETLTDYLRGIGMSLFSTGGSADGKSKGKGKAANGMPAVSPSDYQRVMRQIRDRPDANVIQTVMLRSMRQAVYQEENRGHFGLGYDAYTHFTSPIRRYPDLLVHRALRLLIREGNTAGASRREGAPAIERASWLPYAGDELRVLGEHCSMTERRADEATRDVVQRLKCEYMLQHVGEEFPGVVSAVTGFGLFVSLNDIYIEGLVHISSLESDYWHFDPVRHRLTGERSGAVLALGDTVRVKVAAVNVDERKIDLLLAGRSTRTGRGGSGAGAKEQLAAEAARKPHPKAKGGGERASDGKRDSDQRTSGSRRGGDAGGGRGNRGRGGKGGKR
jgi:ribonuclease R